MREPRNVRGARSSCSGTMSSSVRIASSNFHDCDDTSSLKGEDMDHSSNNQMIEQHSKLVVAGLASTPAILFKTHFTNIRILFFICGWSCSCLIFVLAVVISVYSYTQVSVLVLRLWGIDDVKCFGA